MIIFLPVQEIGIGDGAFLKSRSLRVDGDEFVGIRERQRIQEHAVDDREQGGIRANSQCERKDGDRRKSGILRQHAQSEAHVLQETHHWTLSSGTPTPAGLLEIETNLACLLFREKTQNRRIGNMRTN